MWKPTSVLDAFECAHYEREHIASKGYKKRIDFPVIGKVCNEFPI